MSARTKLRAERVMLFQGAVFAFAIGCEAVWGASKFHGGWPYAYGAVAVVAFGLSAAFWRARKALPKEPDGSAPETREGGNA